MAIITHYDSFGGAPVIIILRWLRESVLLIFYSLFYHRQDLSVGGDSNASGVAALMELVRLFSRLASQPGQNGLSLFNLVFAVTGGGKLNFLGSKKFLEDQLDGADGGLFQDTVFALCLDSLGKGEELNVHVSKPPKEGSNSATFIEVKASLDYPSFSPTVQSVS